jgi:hypothetical protein
VKQTGACMQAGWAALKLESGLDNPFRRHAEPRVAKTAGYVHRFDTTFLRGMTECARHNTGLGYSLIMRVVRLATYCGTRNELHTSSSKYVAGTAHVRTF